MSPHHTYAALSTGEKDLELPPRRTSNSFRKAGELLLVFLVLFVCFKLSEVSISGHAIGVKCPQPDPVSLSSVSLGLREQEARDAAVVLLQEAIRIPTVGYDDMKPPGEDERWAPFDDFNAWLETSFPVLFDKAETEVVSKYTHLFTLKGKRDHLLPAILIHHIDVVPVYNAELWSYPPFAAHVEDGWLYGRGASDDKGNLIAMLVAFETLLKTGWHPERTTIIVAHQDEESSSEFGSLVVSDMLEKRLGRKGAAFLFDEGDGAVGDLYGQKWMVAEVGEKGYADLEMTVSIPGGHSADPKKHTSISVLLQLAAAYDASKRLTPNFTPDHPLVQQAACIAEYGKGDIPKLLGSALQKGDLGRLHRYIMPVFQTTTMTPTVLSAGGKSNVIPPVARATFNHRLAVGTTMAEINKTLISAIAPILKRAHLTLGKEVTLKWLYAQDPPFLSPTASPAYEALVSAARGAFDDVMILPNILPGATDSRNYQNVARQIYRFSPTSPHENVAHATDERIEVEAYVAAMQFYIELLLGIDKIRGDDS